MAVKADTMLNLFQKFGLEEKEAKVLLCIIKNSANTPSSISRETKIKRSTVYLQIEKLEKKGLIFFQINGKTKHIVPLSNDDLFEKMLEQKKKEWLNLKNAEIKLKKNLAKLRTEKEDGYSNTKVEYSCEKKRLISILYDILYSKKDIFWLGDLTVLFEIISEDYFYRNFTLNRLKTNTTTFAITDKSILHKKKFSELINNFRQFRFLDDKFLIPSLLAIFGSKIVLFTKKKKKPNLVIIDDEVMSQTILFLFKNLWKRMAS